MSKILFVSAILLLTIYSVSAQSPDTGDDIQAQNNLDTLVVLWTSGDPEVANKVCFMYTHAAFKYGWFKSVILIVWGPSAKLLSQDSGLQEKIKSMIADGIHVQACIVCSDSYEVTDILKNLGIEVIGMGNPLTEYLKKDYRILTF